MPTLPVSGICALFVSPEAQGMGYGHRLHEVMIDWLRTQNAPTLCLTTGSQTRACGFYERRGWQLASVSDSGEARYELPKVASLNTAPDNVSST